MGLSESRFQRKVRELVKEVLGENEAAEWCNQDEFQDMDSLHNALKKAGVESCNLIVGIDFTGSNRTQGRRTFNGQCLHELNSQLGPNPYEMVLGIMCQALAPFDDDQSVPAYVFGDVETKHHSVRPLSSKHERHLMDNSASGLITAYRLAAANPAFSGPTSFAPLINRAVQIVKDSDNSFHMLLILADGQVDQNLGCLEQTRHSIVEASHYPLSIVVIGIGDGPWDPMRDFDDNLPEREFDNFQFVCFEKFQELMSSANESSKKLVETAFAVCAMQEVPQQFQCLVRQGQFAKGSRYPAARPELKRPALEDETNRAPQASVKRQRTEG